VSLPDRPTKHNSDKLSKQPPNRLMDQPDHLPGMKLLASGLPNTYVLLICILCNAPDDHVIYGQMHTWVVTMGGALLLIEFDNFDAFSIYACL